MGGWECGGGALKGRPLVSCASPCMVVSCSRDAGEGRGRGGRRPLDSMGSHAAGSQVQGPCTHLLACAGRLIRLFRRGGGERECRSCATVSVWCWERCSHVCSRVGREKEQAVTDALLSLLLHGLGTRTQSWCCRVQCSRSLGAIGDRSNISL